MNVKDGMSVNDAVNVDDGENIISSSCSGPLEVFIGVVFKEAEDV